MTNPTTAPIDSDRRVADEPGATTLPASLNGDAVPTVRPVTRADNDAGNPPARSTPATDVGVRTAGSSADPDDEQAPWEEWNGIFVGYAICQRETFESRSR